MRVSYFNGIKNPNKLKDVNLIDFLTTDHFKNDVEAIRNGDTSKKMQLGAVTPHARFDIKRGELLPDHSGILFVDIDGKDQTLDVALIKRMFTRIAQTVAVRYSSSGNGVHAFINIGLQDLERCHLTMKKLMLDVGVVIDKTKDYSRLCFASYDNETYINEDAVELTPYPDEVLYPKVIQDKVTASTKEYEVGQPLDEFTKYCKMYDNDFNNGRNNWVFHKAAKGKSMFELSEQQTVEALIAYQQKDFPASEIKQAVRSAFR